MKVIFGLGKLKIKKIHWPVVTIGVFDGLHRGHMKLLKETLRCARRINGLSVVVTFCPHPKNKLSLYSLEHRLKLFKKLGIDICIVLRFSKSFSRISAEAFIKKFLLKIKPRYIIVGENFHFGRSAKGTPELLERLSKIYDFKLKVVRVVKLKKKTISSTDVRFLITQGRLKEAEELLSRPVTILGTVVRGGRWGRRLGFPTANIYPNHEVIPPAGVYIARAFLNKNILKGLCYIGNRPSFSKGAEDIPNINIEMYILDFNRNLYGKDLEIQFIKKIRNERKFTSLASLSQQIKKDIKLSQSYFNPP